jgi:acid phosphatase type 7
MKVEKIDGKYRKKVLKLTSRVPVLMVVMVVVLGAAVVTAAVLRTNIIDSQDVLESGPIREHSFTVVAVGDIACEPDNINYNDGFGIVGACQQKAVGEAVAKEKADAVVLLGDIQYMAGNAADFERSFVPYWRGVIDPMYVVAGNHDYGNGARSPGDLNDYYKEFKAYFPNATTNRGGKTYYDFGLGTWRLYTLDSNCEYVSGCGIESPQYNWLTSKVYGDKAVCSIAMWHHPVRTSGQHKEADSVTRGRAFDDYLTSQNVDIILNGHDHNYERIKTSAGSPRQFVAGTGGFSLRKTSEPLATGSEKIIEDQFGYLKLQLYPGRYKWEFKSVQGETLDSGEDICK